MKITSVKCDFLLVPVVVPVRTEPKDFGVLLVQVETDSGVVGIGLAREHDFHALAVRQCVVNDIGPWLLTKGDRLDPGYIWREASFELAREYQSPHGSAARAMSAVDQALWDIRGKDLGMPVYRLLGGATDEIQIYTTFGLNFYTPEEEDEAARYFLDKGFTHFKLMGADADRGRDIQHDAERVRRLRSVVGDEAEIILDGRSVYSLYSATALAKMIEPYRLAYFDEPTYARDPHAYQKLREAVPSVPLAARSSGGNIYSNRDLVLSGAIDVLGSNVLDQGGYTHAVKMANFGEAFQLPLVTGGGWHLQNAHLIAAANNGWMTEYLTPAAGICDYIFKDAIQPVNGKLRLSDKPGLGLELDHEAVAEVAARAATVLGRWSNSGARV